jgi:hypothetical protein
MKKDNWKIKGEKKKREWHKKQLEVVQQLAPETPPSIEVSVPKIETEQIQRPRVVQPPSTIELGIEKVKPEPGADLDKTREYIVKEILSTEKTYIDSLEEAMKKYYEPMLQEAEKDPQIDKELLHKIFGNMKLILPINQNHLYDVLVQRVTNWNSKTLIGDLFVNFAHLLKMYTQYSNGYDVAMKSLDIIATQSWFPRFCQVKVLIESLLIMPIQRIPRYNLLLTDLYRHTPSDHADDSNILKALNNIRNTASHVNEGIAKHKNFDKLASEGLAFLLEAHRTLSSDDMLMVVRIEDKKKEKKRESEKRL